MRAAFSAKSKNLRGRRHFFVLWNFPYVWLHMIIPGYPGSVSLAKCQCHCHSVSITKSRSSSTMYDDHTGSKWIQGIKKMMGCNCGSGICGPTVVRYPGTRLVVGSETNDSNNQQYKTDPNNDNVQITS